MLRYPSWSRNYEPPLHPRGRVLHHSGRGSPGWGQEMHPRLLKLAPIHKSKLFKETWLKSLNWAKYLRFRHHKEIKWNSAKYVDPTNRIFLVLSCSFSKPCLACAAFAAALMTNDKEPAAPTAFYSFRHQTWQCRHSRGWWTSQRSRKHSQVLKSLITLEGLCKSPNGTTCLGPRNINHVIPSRQTQEKTETG